MKKLFIIFILLALSVILFSSIISSNSSTYIENQNYAARVPLPIPPPPEYIK